MRELADTTVLNNFAQVLRPDLLQMTFPGLVAPRRVMEELRDGERLGAVPVCDWRWLEILQPTEDEHRHARGLARHLDPGEAECLAMAQARGWAVLTDDRAARTHAQLLGIEVTGTLGVLDRLIESESLSIEQADALLLGMIGRGYRSPVRSLQRQ